MDLSRTNDALRACDIKRWHMVSTVRPQNLAEHSFSVAIIASAIAREIGMVTEATLEVVYYALLHDLDEVYTGDIPSHTKQRLRDFGFNWRNMEGAFGVCPGPYKAIIKAADFIEAIRFGNENCQGYHPHQVLTSIRAEFEKFCQSLPEDLLKPIEKVAKTVIYRIPNDRPKEWV